MHSLKLGIAKMCCFNYLSNWPRWKLIQLLISHVFCVPCCLFEISCQECHNLIWVRISMYDLITILCFLQPSDSCLVKWKPLLFYGEVKELRLVFSLCVTMNLRDRVGKIVRMKSLKNENLKKTKIRNDFESEMPQNWKWMKIWKMKILNDQNKEWFWSKMPQNWNWKENDLFWWQNFLKN